MAKMFARIKDEQARQEKLIRHILKRSYNQGEERPVKSLREAPRAAYDEEQWEYYTEYGFLSDRTDLTDEEIQELLDEMWLKAGGQYDCTGWRFSCWIDTHKNPSGLVSYVHQIGFDV